MIAPPPRDLQAGVTLVEMLVAVALCALIGVAGFTMLDTILRSNGRAEAELARVTALDRAFSALRRDLLEADAGRLRIADGQLRLPGRAYGRVDGTLIRVVGDPPLEQSLVDGIAGARFRALDAEGGWQADWPPEGDPRAPRAVELTLEPERGAPVTRLFSSLSQTAPPDPGL